MTRTGFQQLTTKVYLIVIAITPRQVDTSRTLAFTQEHSAAPAGQTGEFNGTRGSQPDSSRRSLQDGRRQRLRDQPASASRSVRECLDDKSGWILQQAHPFERELTAPRELFAQPGRLGR